MTTEPLTAPLRGGLAGQADLRLARLLAFSSFSSLHKIRNQETLKVTGNKIKLLSVTLEQPGLQITLFQQRFGSKLNLNLLHCLLAPWGSLELHQALADTEYFLFIRGFPLTRAKRGGGGKL